MIKICPVCGVESKALHMHLKKHTEDEIEVAEFKRQVEINKNNIKAIEPVTQPPAEPIPDVLVGEDIKITEEILDIAPIEEPVTNVNGCEYQLILNINNEQLECFTNNLKISILSYARPIGTDGFITIKKGEAEFVKKMTLVKFKQLFQDDQQLDIFLETFYGLYGQPQNLVNG